MPSFILCKPYVKYIQSLFIGTICNIVVTSDSVHQSQSESCCVSCTQIRSSLALLLLRQLLFLSNKKHCHQLGDVNSCVFRCLYHVGLPRLSYSGTSHLYLNKRHSENILHYILFEDNRLLKQSFQMGELRFGKTHKD